MKCQACKGENLQVEALKHLSYDSLHHFLSFMRQYNSVLATADDVRLFGRSCCERHLEQFSGGVQQIKQYFAALNVSFDLISRRIKSGRVR